MRLLRLLFVIMITFVCPAFSVFGAGLPAGYYKLMAAEVAPGDGANEAAKGTGIRLAAAVLFTLEHPDNQHRGDQMLLALAKRLGDQVTSESENNTNENRQG